MAITDVHDQDWIGYSQIDFGSGIARFRARVASGSAQGGAIHVFVDGADVFSNLPGRRIGSCSVSPTGGSQAWAVTGCAVEVTSGVHDVYLRFSGEGSEALFSLDYFQFE